MIYYVRGQVLVDVRRGVFLMHNYDFKLIFTYIRLLNTYFYVMYLYAFTLNYTIYCIIYTFIHNVLLYNVYVILYYNGYQTNWVPVTCNDTLCIHFLLYIYVIFILFYIVHNVICLYASSLILNDFFFF